MPVTLRCRIEQHEDEVAGKPAEALEVDAVPKDAKCSDLAAHAIILGVWDCESGSKTRTRLLFPPAHRIECDGPFLVRKIATVDEQVHELPDRIPLVRRSRGDKDPCGRYDCCHDPLSNVREQGWAR